MKRNTKKFRLALTWLTLAVLLLSVFGAVPMSADATPDHYVDPAGSNTSPYDTWAKAAHKIQDAIDAAAAGDTVHVAAAMYNEDVTVNKSLTLNGAQAGVDARGRSASESEIVGSIKVTSAAGDVTIDGFKITGTGAGPLAGVCMRIESEAATIKNNIIEAVEATGGYTYSGFVDLDGVSDVLMEQNYVYGAYEDDRAPNAIRIGVASGGTTIAVQNNELDDCGGGGGVGIMCGNADAVINVTGNEFNHTGDGIWVWNGGGSNFDTLSITDNDIHHCNGCHGAGGCSENIDTGVKLVGTVAGTVVITGNDFQDNSIQLDDTAEVLVIEDVLANNTFDRAVTVDHPGASLLHTIWSKIQDGVDAAVDGDTVFVAAGTYSENGIDASGKFISIVGAGSDVTQLYVGAGTGFKISGPGCANISGFEIYGDGRSAKYSRVLFHEEGAGGTSTSDMCTFQDNVVHDVNYGCYTNDRAPASQYWAFLNNEFYELRIPIMLEGTQYVDVVGNTMKDYKEGVCMNYGGGPAQPLRITDNMFLGDRAYPADRLAAILIASDATDVQVLRNTIQDSVVGVLIKQKDPATPDLANVHINNNSIVGNDEGVKNESTTSVDAENNYWGSGYGPLDDGSSTECLCPFEGGWNCDAPCDENIEPAGQLGDKVSDYVDYCPWSLMSYWKPQYPDYAPSGMPDFDQRQDAWTNPTTGKWSFCGPVAVANCFWWFDSKFESLLGGAGAPGDGNDLFPLVRDYTDNLGPVPGPNWDDHNVNNANDLGTAWPPGGPPPALPPFTPGPQPQPQPIAQWGELIERLAWCMDTDGVQSGIPGSGTNVFTMEACIDSWLTNEGLDRHFYEKTVAMPSFEWVEREVERSEDVILLLGFYEEISPEVFERRGGHYVTVAGVNSEEGWIAFSDPCRDNAEVGGAGRVRDGSIIPHTPKPHVDPTIHNDAGNVSHDAYQVMSDSPSPGGEWGLIDYWDVDLMELDDNENPGFTTVPLVEPPAGPMFTEVEYAVVISPKPVLWVEPCDGWVAECEDDITIEVKMTANEFNGVEYYLDFNPDLLEVVNLSEGSMWSGYDYAVMANEVVDSGTIWFAAYLQEPDTNISVYDEQVATIVFHGKDAGVSDLHFHDAIVSNTEGESIEPVFLEDCTLTVFGHGCVHGVVEVQGRFGPDWDCADITVSGGPGGSYNYNTHVDNLDGTWEICDIVEGDYDVEVEMALYLDGLKTGVSITDSGNTDVGQVKVLGGDCNDDQVPQDDCITILDASIIATEFGNSSPLADPRADVNDDGTVNVLDCSLLGGNWQKCSPVPW